jgi:hypothetical protein
LLNGHITEIPYSFRPIDLHETYPTTKPTTILFKKYFKKYKDDQEPPFDVVVNWWM